AKPTCWCSAAHARLTALAGSGGSNGPQSPLIITWASCPARIGAANDVPLQIPKPLWKLSGSIVARRPSPGTYTEKLDWDAASNVTGKVLTSAAPGPWQVTHGPALLNRAIVRSGLSAPTLISGTQLALKLETWPPA